MLAFGTHSAITHNCSDTFAGAITSYMESTRYTLFDLEYTKSISQQLESGKAHVPFTSFDPPDVGAMKPTLSC